MLVIGTIGNVLSLVILTRKPMRKLSTYTYLAVLSMTDTLVLYIGLLRIWVSEITGKDVREHASWMCKTTNVLGYTVSDYSVWLIIAMTVERWIAVCLPLKAPSMCNRKRAFIAILGIFFLLLSVNFHFFWTTDLRNIEYEGEIFTQCDSSESYEKLVTEIWPWVDAFIYSFFPFVIILTLNGLIIHRVLLSKRQRSGLDASRSAYSKPDDSGAGGINRPQRNSHSEHSTKLTVMLLTISFTFLLTTLPMNMLLIVKAFITQKEVSTEVITRFMLARTVTELLMYSNHSMNFFLYCATGEKFRQQLLLLLCPGRQSSPNVRWHSDYTQGHTEKSMLTPPNVRVNGTNIRGNLSPLIYRDQSPTRNSPGYQETSLMVPEPICLTQPCDIKHSELPGAVLCRVNYSENRSDVAQSNGITTCKVDCERARLDGEV